MAHPEQTPLALPSNTYFGTLGVTIFEEMSQLAAKHNSTNLGQVRAVCCFVACGGT